MITKALLQLLFLTLLAYTTAAKASLYVEPLLGFTMAKSSNKTLSASPFIGSRLGITHWRTFLALEYKMSSSSQITNSSPSMQTEESATSIALGYDFPLVPIALVARYILHEAWQYDQTLGAHQLTREDSGSGFGIGVATTILPLIHINFEINFYTLDTTQVTSGEATTLPSIYERVNEYLFSISLPLSF